MIRYEKPKGDYARVGTLSDLLATILEEPILLGRVLGREGRALDLYPLFVDYILDEMPMGLDVYLGDPLKSLLPIQIRPFKEMLTRKDSDREGDLFLDCEL